MADAIPPIKVSIVADTSGLKAGVDQATKGIKDMEDSVKTASTGMGNFVGKLKQVGATLGVVFAGQQVLQFGKDVIMASSNMAESLSKVQVVFGQNAEAVEKWGNTSATAMGMSKQAALEAAGTYGNLFQAFGLGQKPAQEMSTSLVQLASDMASFNNTSIDDAILALRSGLSGETEPLKRFGVALNEVRLKQEALDLGLIKSTKEALTPAAKAQAAYALIMHDTKLAQGDYARTSDGTANTMRTLAAQFENAKVALGDALMPAFRALLAVLKVTIPVLTTIGEFFKNNKDEVKAFGITVGIIATAWGAYTVAINAAKIAQAAMNAVMAINPMVALAVGIGLAVAGLVKLYNSSETFRKAVVAMAKVALNAFAAIIPMIGQVAEAIVKLLLTPFKTLLSALSHLPGVGKYAKAGLDLLNKGINGISDFADSAAKKAKSLAAGLDDVAKKADAAAKKTKDATKATTEETKKTKEGTLTEDQKKKLEKYKKDVTKIYKEINDTIAEANEKAAEALDKRNETMLEAQKDYQERVENAQKNYQERIEDAEYNYNERVADLQYTFNDVKEKAEKRYLESVLEANTRYAERTAEIQQNYDEKKTELKNKYLETIAKAEKNHNEKVLDLHEKYEETRFAALKRYDKALADALERRQKAEKAAIKTHEDSKLQTEKDYVKKVLDLNKNLETKLADAREAAAKKSADLTKAATDKQLSIVQQSMDRLRNAFASKTTFDLSVAFGEKGSADSLLANLKKSLASAKKLQENAATLAGMGYSQIFIEEVVKQGPEAGNKIADALKNASPEATAELQSLYSQVQTVSAHGLDALAATMNQGGKLATEELTNAYYAVSTDLATALAEVQTQLQTNLSDINAAYQTAMLEAQAVRDEKLADAKAKFEEALVNAKTTYDESVADASATLQEALATAKKNLDDAMADALKTLNEAKAQAKKDLDEGLAEAEKTYTEAFAKAKKDLDNALADAKKTLVDAMAEAQKDLDKGLADAEKSLKKAREDAKKALDEALAAAQKTLQDALIKAQKDYEDSIDAINKATEAKLESLKTKLKEVAALIAELGKAQAAAAALTSAPVYTPITPVTSPVDTTSAGQGQINTATGSGNITVNVTGVNLTDPNQTATSVANEIKYGSYVRIANILVPSTPGID